MWFVIALLVFRHVCTFYFLVIPVQVAGYLVLPFVIPFLPYGVDVHLPKAFKWFDNSDPNEPMYGAGANRQVWVDKGWFDPVTLEPKNRWYLWITRYYFIGLRNPCMHFRTYTLGFSRHFPAKIMYLDYRINYLGSLALHLFGETFPRISNDDGGSTGWYLIVIRSDEGYFFEFYGWWPYRKKLFGKYLGNRIRIGHVMQNPSNPVAFEFNINPFSGNDNHRFLVK